MRSGRCGAAWRIQNCASNCAVQSVSEWRRSTRSSRHARNTTRISAAIILTGTSTSTSARTRSEPSRNSPNCSASTTLARCSSRSLWRRTAPDREIYGNNKNPPDGLNAVRPADPLKKFYDNFFFASSGTSTLVLPASLISTVVVRSTSRVLPLKSTVPWTWNSYLVSWPSLIQNFTEPLALVMSGPPPPPGGGPNERNDFAPSSVRSLEIASPFLVNSFDLSARSAASAAGALKFFSVRGRNMRGLNPPPPSSLARSASDCQPAAFFAAPVPLATPVWGFWVPRVREGRWFPPAVFPSVGPGRNRALPPGGMATVVFQL